MAFQDLLKHLPEVEGPSEKLGFNEKAKWTLIILGAFFILANISLFALSNNSLDRFENLAVLLGTDFGSVISLGIGPIVMASIILQLLVGSKIIEIDTSTAEGKKFFQGVQKLMVLFFIVFEAMIYVLMRGLEASPGYAWILILQLCLGGLAILFMDELSHKWGFGSGVSLFIAAGVSWRLFTSLFQFMNLQGGFEPTGRLLVFVNAIITGNQDLAILAGSAILVTILIFLAVVWAQALKVEIPLSYDRIRGYGMKWPLAFFYTSVIPVILVSALAANVQLFAGILQGWLGHGTILGRFPEVAGAAGGNPIGGFVFWINPTNILEAVITNSFTGVMIWQVLGHILFYMFFSVLFGIFWVKTSGMDAQSQAKNIMSSGLTIPGFRKDPRILESVLERYIMPLTIMGGLAIGLLASLSNVSGTLVGGTSILLVVMIMYQFYQSIAQQHSMDMHPALKKIIKQ